MVEIPPARRDGEQKRRRCDVQAVMPDFQPGIARLLPGGNFGPGVGIRCRVQVLQAFAKQVFQVVILVKVIH